MKKEQLLSELQSHSWHIWGSRLDFKYPKNAEGGDFVDTKAEKPGAESSTFYDHHYDVIKGDEADLAELQKSNTWEGLLGRLISFRRRFIHTWYPNIAGRRESFFSDIWVVRNSSQGDLSISENLQKAEAQFLRIQEAQESVLDMLAEAYSCEHEDAVVYTGINWHMELKNGYKWQVYEEYNRKDKLSEVILYPLGPSHYLKIRMYHMSIQGYCEFQELLNDFCSMLKSNMKIRPMVVSSSAEVGSLEPSDLGLHGETSETWETINESVQSDNFVGVTETLGPLSDEELEFEVVPTFQEQEDKVSVAPLREKISVGICWLVGIVCVIAGLYKNFQMFKHWELPAAYLIGLMISFIPLSYLFRLLLRQGDNVTEVGGK